MDCTDIVKKLADENYDEFGVAVLLDFEDNQLARRMLNGERLRLTNKQVASLAASLKIDVTEVASIYEVKLPEERKEIKVKKERKKTKDINKNAREVRTKPSLLKNVIPFNNKKTKGNAREVMNEFEDDVG